MAKPAQTRRKGFPNAAFFTECYIAVMLLLFPVFTGFQGYSAITASKFYFFLSATVLWLLCLLISGIFALGAGGRPAIRTLRPVQWAVLAFAAVCCLSAACSDYGTAVLLGAGRYEGLLTLLLYCAVFLGISAFGRPRRRHLYFFGIATTVCCAVALLQLLGLDPLWLFPGDLIYYDANILYNGEFLGTIGNANLTSALLSLAIPLSAAGFITGDEDKWSPLLLIPAALGFWVLLASGVSGGLVALAFCALLGVPVLIRTPSQLHRALIIGCALCAAAALALAFQGQRLGDGTCTLSFAFSPSAWAALAGAAIFAVLALVMKKTGFAPGARPLGRFLWALSGVTVLAALVLVYFYPFPSGTLYELHEVLHGNWQDSFGSSRLQIWRETLTLVPEHPLLGGGPDTLALRLDIEFSRYVPETGQTMSTFVDNAHNEYLGILVNEGALGLAAYLTALVLTLMPWLRRKDVPRLLPVLGCGLAAYWVQSFFGLGLCLTAPLLWIFWGLAQTRPPREPLSAPAEGKAPSSRKNKPKTAR